MTGRTSAGSGKSNDSACIVVVCTANTHVQCVKGNTVLSTEANSNGRCIFVVPEAGLWTVSADDGISQSESVAISAKYQVAEVYLSRYLYDTGNTYDGVTGGYGSANWTVNGAKYGGTIEADKLHFAGHNSATTLLGTGNTVDLTPYSAIHIIADIISTYSASEASLRAYITLAMTLDTRYAPWIKAQVDSGKGVTGAVDMVLDVSQINGLCWIAMSVGGTTAYVADVIKIYLQK